MNEPDERDKAVSRMAIARLTADRDGYRAAQEVAWRGWPWSHYSPWLDPIDRFYAIVRGLRLDATVERSLGDLHARVTDVAWECIAGHFVSYAREIHQELWDEYRKSRSAEPGVETLKSLDVPRCAAEAWPGYCAFLDAEFRDLDRIEAREKRERRRKELLERRRWIRLRIAAIAEYGDAVPAGLLHSISRAPRPSSMTSILGLLAAWDRAAPELARIEKRKGSGWGLASDASEQVLHWLLAGRDARETIEALRAGAHPRGDVILKRLDALAAEHRKYRSGRPTPGPLFCSGNHPSRRWLMRLQEEVGGFAGERQ